MGFKCFKATTTTLQEDSLLLTITPPGSPGTHLINLGGRKDWINLGATQQANCNLGPLLLFLHWYFICISTTSNLYIMIVSNHLINQIINKHNQKLINILENQKIYGGFLKILIFQVSSSRTHLNGLWKVKPKISVFWKKNYIQSKKLCTFPAIVSKLFLKVKVFLKS